MVKKPDNWVSTPPPQPLVKLRRWVSTPDLLCFLPTKWNCGAGKILNIWTAGEKFSQRDAWSGGGRDHVRLWWDQEMDVSPLVGGCIPMKYQVFWGEMFLSCAGAVLLHVKDLGEVNGTGFYRQPQQERERRAHPKINGPVLSRRGCARGFYKAAMGSGWTLAVPRPCGVLLMGGRWAAWETSLRPTWVLGCVALLAPLMDTSMRWANASVPGIGGEPSGFGWRERSAGEPGAPGRNWSTWGALVPSAVNSRWVWDGKSDILEAIFWSSLGHLRCPLDTCEHLCFLNHLPLCFL